VVLLATRGLLRHRAEALLLLVAITTATTTLSVAFAFGSVADLPWERTRALTAGPDVWVRVVDDAALDRVAGAAEVTAAGRRHRMYQVDDLASDRGRVSALVQLRDRPEDAVDRPALVTGTWAGAGGLVVERAFADALAVGPGDTVRLSGRPLRVTGIAVTTSRSPYPSNTPGLVWATSVDDPWIAAAAEHRYTTVALRLADPATATTFAASVTSPDGTVQAQPWQATREWTLSDQRLVRDALLIGAWTLALLAIAGVVVLAGGRMAGCHRRAGLLKAVGATPRLVAAVLLMEHLAVAVTAAGAGLLLGGITARLLVRPSVGLVDTALSPGIGPTGVLVVVVMAVSVTSVATLPPALRAARLSTVRALAETTRPPRRSPLLIGLSARTPAPFLIGLRQVARRPRRAVLATLNLTLTVAMVVSALTMRHHLDGKGGHMPTGPDFVPGAGNPIVERLDRAALAVMIALLAMAAMNVILLCWATVVDTARGTALLRAVGASLRQVTVGLTVAQLAPALVAGLAGIPLGLGFVRVAARVAGVERGEFTPPVGWLVPVPLATLAVVAVLMAVPARAGLRRPVTEILASE